MGFDTLVLSSKVNKDQSYSQMLQAENQCYPYLPIYCSIVYLQGINQRYCHTSDKQEHCGGVKVINHGYLLVCISLCFMMTTIQGFQRHYFWINITIDTFETSPYHFNDILPWKHFRSIPKIPTITNKTPPLYTDKFWESIQMIDRCNHNTEINFSPIYTYFLVEPMIKWVKRYTLLGFMFVP